MTEWLRGTSVRWFDIGIVCTIAALSVAALQPNCIQYAIGPWQPSFFVVLPETALAAVRVWAFWGLATAVVGAMLLRHSESLGLGDSVLGGAMTVWVIAYVGSHLIGPLGLLSPWTIWLTLGLGAAVVVARPPTIPSLSLSGGTRLALLAFAITAPTLLLLQLGSPVPPHFDVFAPVASAQRVVTFRTYLPFDNDPYGYYDAASQCPGTELLYAVLALGAGMPLAVLAETAAIVPLTALLILGTYRLGKTLGGSDVGGMAALLLFSTVLFRMLPTGHGRYVAFVPAVVGLAFILDARRNPIRLLLGALFLGTAVAAHAIIGTFAMVTVAATVAMWIVSGDLLAGLAGIGLLAGASLVAMPTVAVGLRMVVPYPILPLIQMLGVAVAMVSALWMPQRPPREARWLLALVTVAVVTFLVVHPTAVGKVYDHWVGWRYPLLWIGGSIGIGVVVFTGTGVVRAPMVFAILGGIGAELLSRHFEGASDPRVSIAVQDLVFKVDFWYPFALVFPAACLASALAQRLSRRWVLYVLLVLLWFPWQYGNPRPGGRDPNYFQHSIAESWAEQLSLAKMGYWGSTGDRRWAQSSAEFELIDTLRGEIAAGRITLDTHIVHLTPYIYLYKDTLLFSAFTGINDDLYVSEYVFDQSTAGGRFYPANKIHAALAAHPPYVVIHDRTVNAVSLTDTFPDTLALDGYDEIFNRDGVRLLRLSSITDAPA